MSSQAATKQDSALGVIPAAAWRATALTVLPEYRLAVAFQDGTSGFVDLSSVKTPRDPGMFALLADPRVFEKAHLDLSVVTRPNGADLDPAWMYERIREGKTWSCPYLGGALDHAAAVYVQPEAPPMNRGSKATRHAAADLVAEPRALGDENARAGTARHGVSVDSSFQWKPFTSRQRVVTPRPGFVWQGKVQ